MTVELLSLPAEVLHSIFAKVEPVDLSRLKRCCHTIDDFLKSNWLLYKDVFLHCFDDPRSPRLSGNHDEELSWEAILYSYVKAGKILVSKDRELKLRQRLFVAEAIERLVLNSGTDSEASRNLEFLTERFQKHVTQNTEIFLCCSSLFKWAKADLWKESSVTHAPTLSDLVQLENDVPLSSDQPATESSETEDPEAELKLQKLSAKIHCLYGVPSHEVYRPPTSRKNGKRYSLRTDTAPLDPYVRSQIYDLRQHMKNENGSFWGPFLPDGTQEVDWEKVEAIMCMLNINITAFLAVHEDNLDHFNQHSFPDWTIPFKTATPHSYRSQKVNIPMQPSLPLEAQDPYNVTGTWMRLVCFLDYSELYNFNFGPDVTHPLGPLDAEEATRPITMRIRITEIKPPGPDDGQALPVVYFKGGSSSPRLSWDADAHSEIREQGFVRLTPQGEVRWTTWSVFYGEERWRSEGIQVGGVQSARGVFGFWFDKDFDEHGPAGPTAFWKFHDGIDKRERSSRPLADALHALHVPLY